jgi:hypothetical protein
VRKVISSYFSFWQSILHKTIYPLEALLNRHKQDGTMSSLRNILDGFGRELLTHSRSHFGLSHAIICHGDMGHDLYMSWSYEPRRMILLGNNSTDARMSRRRSLLD